MTIEHAGLISLESLKRAVESLRPCHFEAEGDLCAEEVQALLRWSEIADGLLSPMGNC